GPENHILILILHHIVSDGWSNGVILRELSALYNALSAGSPSSLPALAVQYADYAAWQRNWLQGETLQREIVYWKTQLAGAPPLTTLPTDRPRGTKRNYQGDRETLSLPQELSRKLVELGRDERATMFMVLLAAFNVLLYRYTDQQDIVVGTDEAGRNHPALEGLIGFFINHLVLRTDLTGNPTFRDLVRRVRAVCVGAYAHQDLPFDKLVDVLRPERETSHTPLFQVLFVLNNGVQRSDAFKGKLQVSGVNLATSSSKYDLALFIGNLSSGLTTSWVYQTDLFDAQTIRGMAADFEAVVRCVAENPDTTVAKLKGLLMDLSAKRLATRSAENRLATRVLLRPRASRSPEMPAPDAKIE
ncbi:MAG TPA: condensation domain-containing protein, partial [Chthonomonadaceae bacterium]|nr:condensation domain-containing protein [Chthonomonadaceae bacterium]